MSKKKRDKAPEDFDHVCCPLCKRKLVTIAIASTQELLGLTHLYCPVCLLVYCTEQVEDPKPKLKLTRFVRRIRINMNDTYEIYQTMALCLIQLIEFIDAAWQTKKLTNSAHHLLLTHKKHLQRVLAIIQLRMRELDKRRQ